MARVFDKVLATLERQFGSSYRATCGHRAYGLRYQDLLVETPEVTEAIRRLPPQEQELRTRRLKIANDCAIKQTLLPPELHTKESEDIPYLSPFLKEVMEETKDRNAFRL